MKKNGINNLLKDIRLCVLFFMLIRLVGITNPPLETEHNWRQTTVAMVSRNFLEIDNNIFFPRVDMAGEKTGITGMEFPILNYLVYLMAELFGYQHWYGRLINLIVSSFGLLFFYRLLKKYFSIKMAFYSTIILMVSIWFQFSRKIMPDTFSMSMLIACIYYGSNYLEKTDSKYSLIHLLSYGLLMLLGGLSKLPSLYILIVFIVFYVDNSIKIKRKSIFALVSIFSLTPIFVWYFYWVPFLVEEYGFFHFFMGKDLTQGILEIFQNKEQTLSRFYDTALKFIGFFIFLYGLILSVYQKNIKILSVFLLAFFGFAIIVFKAGYTFFHHNYYVIPFVPIMALVAGYGLSQIKQTKVAIFILALIMIEGVANQIHDFRIKKSNKVLLNLEQDLDTISNKDDLILINSGNYPTPMYFAHRKGWVNSNDKILNEQYIKELKHKGLKYIVILKKSFGENISLLQYKNVLENENYSIYLL